MIVAVLIGCGGTIDCADPAKEIASDGPHTLTCHAAQWPVAYVELLAARPVQRGDEGLALKAVAQRFEADPAATMAWLEDIRAAGHALAGRSVIDGNLERTRRVWAANEGRDLIDADAGELWDVQKRALAVWSTAAEHKLALTEADIEGWIRYASLCREAQQGGVLRISVSDRVSVYKVVRERFDNGTEGEQAALGAMGTVWNHVRTRWPVASFDTQQRWIAAAPLPGPMTATSLGYAQAIIDGPPAGHVGALVDTFGPFTVGTSRSMFSEQLPAP